MALLLIVFVLLLFCLIIRFYTIFITLTTPFVNCKIEVLLNEAIDEGMNKPRVDVKQRCKLMYKMCTE